jgi:secondary thiamine-phosphate synthase enzyme
MFIQKSIKLKTLKPWNDITDLVVQTASEEGWDCGLINVFSRHTTLGLRIYENETLLLDDTDQKLESFAPKNARYAHDNIGIRDVPADEPINGHSHIKSLLFNTSETIPIKDGQTQLGKWQRLVAVELDSPRDRQILITFLGVVK